MKVHTQARGLSKPLVLLMPILFLLGACARPGSVTVIDGGAYPIGVPPPEERVTPTLKNRLGELSTSEFVAVIIRLTEQADVRIARSVIDTDNKEQRRAAVVSHLQQHALNAQGEVLTSLSQLEAAGLVRNVKPLWVANAISAEVRAQAVDQLLRSIDIEYIAADTSAPLFLADTTWNVRQVNAHDVWLRPARSLTGEGIVVAVLDSGVDLDHPDLLKRFWINAAEDIDEDGRLTRADINGVDEDSNGLTDDVVGWDFDSGDNDPSPNLFESGRGRGHGTHVAGIIAGDGTNGTATGIAPGVSLMVLKISSQSSVWAAMQYALANGADIINISLGWPNSLSPDLATWRDVIEAVVDAGVLVVASAGSGGQAPLTHAPAPNDITTPGRVPRAITVGAVAAPTDYSWLDPVTSFSSGGPISWQSVANFRDYPYPPGLLKPDITAPGVGITSTMIGGAYAVKSGTSMATAHVSATAALLLEQRPELLPHELLFIMRETAWQIVDPSNVRGWGRLDALKAVEYAFGPEPYDLAIDATGNALSTESIWIDNDNDGSPDEPVAGMINRVYARVRNTGGQAVGNAEIKFYFTGAGTVSSDGYGSAESAIPDNQTFHKIGSYFAPVVGPAGTSQDTVIGAVDWFVPRSDNDLLHWTLGVDIVAPTPPNKIENNRANNIAFTNHFNITVSPGEIFTFRFFIHGDPRSPSEPFDLAVARRGLPRQFGVELSLDELETEKWVEGMRGFEPVNPQEIAEFPADVDRYVGKSIELLGDTGVLERIGLADGRPLPARLIIRAPAVDDAYYDRGDSRNQNIVISTGNDAGIFGGLTINVGVNPDATEIHNFIYMDK